MARHITNKEEIIWTFPRDGGDDTALGLFQIPEVTGVGKYATVAYNQDKALNEGVYDWKEVDPSKEPFDAEMYSVSNEDKERLRSYVLKNTPKSGILKKLLGKSEKPSDFVSMISAIAENCAGNESSVFFSEP